MSLKMDSSVIWVGQISAECHFKSLYIHLIGTYFLLACVVRVLPTWLTMLAAPVAFGRWTVT